MLQNCLGIIYAVHIENMNVSLETIIGNILGCVYVPSAGQYIYLCFHQVTRESVKSRCMFLLLYLVMYIIWCSVFFLCTGNSWLDFEVIWILDMNLGIFQRCLLA